MRREIYAALLVGGIVFSILYEIIDNNTEMSLTTFLITLHVVAYIYLFEEYRYYRSHNAILASFQFLAIPILLLLIGNLIAPLGYEPGFFTVQWDIFGGIFATSSLASLMLLLPIISILRLTARYYDDRYSGFVFRNKKYGSLKFPLFIHLVSISLLITASVYIGRFDVMGLGYVVVSILQIFVKLIYPGITNRIDAVREDRRRRARQRRGYMSSILRGTPNRSRRGASTVDSDPAAPVRSTNSRTSSSRSRRSRSGGISTTPSTGYREIPTRSRNSSSPPSRGTGSRSSVSRQHSRSRSSRPAPSRSVAEVDQGKTLATASRLKKVKQSKIGKYLPKGNFDASDLQCIVCYDDFSTSSNKNIVVCPECKFPGHEVELKSWLNTSPRCPRCNKEINNSRRLQSGTVSESQYAKFIRKL